VFDVDGLLVDSAAVWEAAFWQTAARLGGQLSQIQVRQLVGLSVASAARRIAHSLGAASQAKQAAHVLGQSLSDATALEPPAAMPGAVALVRELSGRARLGVASTGPAAVVRLMLGGVGLLEAFDQIVTADDAAPKPSPDIYSLACGRLGVDPGRALALEDSAVGARAALTAGLRTVLVGPAWAGAADEAPGLRAAPGADSGALRRLRRVVSLEAPKTASLRICADLADPTLFHLIGVPARLAFGSTERQ
jgi:HAD superfamily hydrolase (TIGR01509 family)